MTADTVKITIHNTSQPIKLTIATGGGGGEVPWYTGETTVTPTREAQTLQTSGLRMPDNVTINPIPSDWGHITYSGYRLRVD